MLFNSLEFAFFLPIVFFVYWLFLNKNLQAQNFFLLTVSYFFYSCWDWRFLFLLIFSTLLDFYTGIKMQVASSSAKRAFWFWLSISVNLGFLGIFKYYNFFASSFIETAYWFGWKLSPIWINIVLPVGISFYTFHGLSYVIDIYNGKIKAEKNFVDYALFVSFFPLLVAGPIERATHLLPQIKKNRIFIYTKTVDGLRQILWGLFKKVVIADSCATYANEIFNQSDKLGGVTLVLGAVFFAFQIYGDFSGYSDIALGTARLFGIELLRNFAYPYFSRDIAEFWRRWHISLSSWFKDYLYIPLGGSKGGNWLRIRNIFAIFIVSGFWHGANWTYLVWGLLNALFILPSFLLKKNRANIEIVAKGALIPSLKDVLSILITFSFTCFAWIFFRADNMHHAFEYIFNIFKHPGSFFLISSYTKYSMVMLAIFLFMIVEWFGREDNFAIEVIGLRWKPIFRYLFYFLITFLIFLFHSKEEQFIYFQF